MLAPWSTREVKRDAGVQEATMCNGAIATRGVTTLSLAVLCLLIPLLTFSRGRCSSSYKVLISKENSVRGDGVCRLFL